jgi:hypothetical protein
MAGDDVRGDETISVVKCAQSISLQHDPPRITVAMMLTTTTTINPHLERWWENRSPPDVNAIRLG